MSDSFNSTQAFEPMLDESEAANHRAQPNDSMFPSTQAFEPPPNQSQTQSFDSIAEADRIIERSLMNFRDEVPSTQTFDVAAEDESSHHDSSAMSPSQMGQTQAFDPDQSRASNLDESNVTDDHVVSQTQAFNVEHDDTQAFDAEPDEEERPNATQAFDTEHEQEKASASSPEPPSSPPATQRFEDTENADGPQSPDEEGGDEGVREEAAKTPPPASPPSDDDDDSPRKRRRLVISDDEDEESGAEGGAEGGARAETSGRASADVSDGAEQAQRDDDDDKNSDAGNDDAKSEVGELIADIFGESDNEKESDEEGTSHAAEKRADDDDDEVRVLGVGGADHRAADFEWDFDVMLRKKKEENKKHRKRRRDGSIDLLSDADDQIKEMIEAMKSAAKEDRHSNTERKPALQKRKMLPFVKSQLRKADLAEALIDNGIMSVVSEWLAPLPDKSLPALEVRTELLKMLQQYNRLEQSVLRQSGLGKAVMLLYKHPRETKENKQAAARLISEWARPIFQLDTDFRALSREERVQRDYEHMPQAKKRRLSVEDGRQKSTDTPEDEEAPSRPGDKGWIGRARVPRPSTKDYVVRPKPNVEGQFRGESGGRKASSRYDRKMRELKDRTKSQKVLHAVGISLEGRKMP